MGHHSRQRRLLFFITAILALVLLGQTLVSSGRWLNQPFPGFFIYQNLTVAPYSVPGWDGMAAGLQSLDRVVSVGGSVLNGRAELYDSVRHLPAGSKINYQVMRNAQRLDLTITSKRFTVRDWLLSFGSISSLAWRFSSSAWCRIFTGRRRRWLCRFASWSWRCSYGFIRCSIS